VAGQAKESTVEILGAGPKWACETEYSRGLASLHRPAPAIGRLAAPVTPDVVYSRPSAGRRAEDSSGVVRGLSAVLGRVLGRDVVVGVLPGLGLGLYWWLGIPRSFHALAGERGHGSDEGTSIGLNWSLIAHLGAQSLAGLLGWEMKSALRNLSRHRPRPARGLVLRPAAGAEDSPADDEAEDAVGGIRRLLGPADFEAAAISMSIALRAQSMGPRGVGSETKLTKRQRPQGQGLVKSDADG